MTHASPVCTAARARAHSLYLSLYLSHSLYLSYSLYSYSLYSYSLYLSFAMYKTVAHVVRAFAVMISAVSKSFYLSLDSFQAAIIFCLRLSFWSPSFINLRPVTIPAFFLPRAFPSCVPSRLG